MAKITISRLFETSKILATKSGQELADLVQYLADFAEQTLRNLRNGLTFADNFNCKVFQVKLLQATDTIINTDSKIPIGIIPIRVVSTTATLDAFGWFIDNNGRVNVNARFSGFPVINIEVVLVILF
jgi:hypothetical protein